MSSKVYSTTRKMKAIDTGDHSIEECNHKIKGRFLHHKPESGLDGKETIRIIDNDGARTTLVPNRNPTEPPIILPKSEMKRLQSKAVVLTKEQKLKMLEESKAKKLQMLEESRLRKEQLMKAQQEQHPKAGSKLSDIEAEAARKSLYLLERAFELRQEQEDEIKAANSLILATKCLAIRRAQIIEKQVMEKELKDEERRLDDMMEQKRQKEISEEEKHHRKSMEKNQRHTREVSQQIKENEVLKLIETEKKEEESRNMNRAMIQMQRDEIEKQKQKRLQQEQVQANLKKANEELEHFKIVQREEQRMIDLRVQEFMQKKAEREAAYEKEIAETKAAKEREIARLLAMQEKAQGDQAAKDELAAKRVQEEVERQWREKERLAALKRKQTIDNVQKERNKQIEDLRKAQALEIQRDEEEFHRVAKVQQEEHEKELLKKKKLRQANECHRRELLSQINEKEIDRIKENKQWFEEGNAIRLEQDVRSLRLQKVLQKKMVRLKEEKLPEIYVKDIERQLHLTN